MSTQRRVRRPAAGFRLSLPLQVRCPHTISPEHADVALPASVMDVGDRVGILRAGIISIGSDVTSAL
jgi:hypothetical protein